jgi:hypothetical protein
MPAPFPLQGLLVQLFSIQLQPIFLGQVVYYLQVGFFIRGLKTDAQTKAISQGQFFLQGIHTMHFLPHLALVTEEFPHQVTTIRGGID